MAWIHWAYHCLPWGGWGSEHCQDSSGSVSCTFLAQSWCESELGGGVYRMTGVFVGYVECAM